MNTLVLPLKLVRTVGRSEVRSSRRIAPSNGSTNRKRKSPPASGSSRKSRSSSGSKPTSSTPWRNLSWKVSTPSNSRTTWKPSASWNTKYSKSGEMPNSSGSIGSNPSNRLGRTKFGVGVGGAAAAAAAPKDSSKSAGSRLSSARPGRTRGLRFTAHSFGLAVGRRPGRARALGSWPPPAGWPSREAPIGWKMPPLYPRLVGFAVIQRITAHGVAAEREPIIGSDLRLTDPAPAALSQPVDQHRPEDDEPQDHLLGEALHVQEIHAVLNDRDDEGAD